MKVKKKKIKKKKVSLFQLAVLTRENFLSLEKLVEIAGRDQLLD